MEIIYNQFEKYLTEKNYNKAITFALDSVLVNKVDLVSFYEDVIYRFLEKNLCYKHQEREVYKDHIYLSVCRTIIENFYLYVEENKMKSNNKKVLVTAPEGELYEIYPRMFYDFFKLLGYEVTYIGVDSSEKEIMNALDDGNFDYLFLSVNNYYNLSKTKDLVETIRKSDNKKIELIISGYAVEKNVKCSKEFGSDYCVKNFYNLEKLKED